MIEKNFTNKIPSKTYIYYFAKLILFLSIPALFLNAIDGSSNAFFSYLFAFFILFGFPFYFIVFLRLRSYSFTLTDTAIEIKSGVISKNVETIPLGNIQNIVESTGLLMRLFGIAKIKIWDASVKSSDTRSVATAEIILEKGDIENFKFLVFNR